MLRRRQLSTVRLASLLIHIPAPGPPGSCLGERLEELDTIRKTARSKLAEPHAGEDTCDVTKGSFCTIVLASLNSPIKSVTTVAIGPTTIPMGAVGAGVAQ
jgi:hypothetical protein